MQKSALLGSAHILRKVLEVWGFGVRLDWILHNNNNNKNNNDDDHDHDEDDDYDDDNLKTGTAYLTSPKINFSYTAGHSKICNFTSVIFSNQHISGC